MKIKKRESKRKVNADNIALNTACLIVIIISLIALYEMIR